MEQVWHDMYGAAAAVLNPRRISEMVEAGGVAAAIESSSARMRVGICADGACTLGSSARSEALCLE